ncbi:glycosyltransferase family 4 protein [Vibrio artabrorum]|uniref:glycosyltransferase family 4 protein n=1 Tax=Vibrio artabrorum TaxID=446374 RepID=UPI00354F428D
MMKKIIYILNVDWFFVSHRLPIAIKAIESGYEVHLACSFTGQREYLESLGIICHNIDFSRSNVSLRGEIKAISKIRNLIKYISPDLVHAVTIKPVLYSGLVLQTFRTPPSFVAAISGLGYVFTASSLRAKFTRYFVSMLYKWALRGKSKLVVFQNTSDLKILRNIVDLSNNETVLIKGSGADLSLYKQSSEPKTNTKIISMACRLIKEKGVYEFVESARIVKTIMPETYFWLIGNTDEGNPNSVKQNEIDNWVDEGIISALGQRNDIAELFSKSHIVTMPSFYGEGVPKVLIEAAACGRPIITTDKPGCRDAIVDKETGLLVPEQDSKALADALMLLLKDDDTRQKMGIKAREFAVKEFDVQSVVSKHLTIYKNLLNPGIK